MQLSKNKFTIELSNSAKPGNGKNRRVKEWFGQLVFSQKIILSFDEKRMKSQMFGLSKFEERVCWEKWAFTLVIVDSPHAAVAGTLTFLFQITSEQTTRRKTSQSVDSNSSFG